MPDSPLSPVETPNVDEETASVNTEDDGASDSAPRSPVDGGRPAPESLEAASFSDNQSESVVDGPQEFVDLSAPFSDHDLACISEAYQIPLEVLRHIKYGSTDHPPFPAPDWSTWISGRLIPIEKETDNLARSVGIMDTSREADWIRSHGSPEERMDLLEHWVRSLSHEARKVYERAYSLHSFPVMGGRTVYVHLDQENPTVSFAGPDPPASTASPSLNSTDDDQSTFPQVRWSRLSSFVSGVLDGAKHAACITGALALGVTAVAVAAAEISFGYSVGEAAGEAAGEAIGSVVSAISKSDYLRSFMEHMSTAAWGTSAALSGG